MGCEQANIHHKAVNYGRRGRAGSTLGSSSAFSNIIAGILLTYTRAFRLGDRIKVNELVGDITERNFLVLAYGQKIFCPYGVNSSLRNQVFHRGWLSVAEATVWCDKYSTKSGLLQRWLRLRSATVWCDE